MTTKYKSKKCGCETSTMSAVSEPDDDGKVKVLDSVTRESLCDAHQLEQLVEKWDGHRIDVIDKDYGNVVGISQVEGMRCFITDKEFAIPYAAYINYLAMSKVDSEGNPTYITKVDGADASKRYVGPHLPSRRKRSYPN
tara:strand:- start:834 stop:1250 length:417 start_codon:yes stop_codon:yes gene_type:complete